MEENLDKKERGLQAKHAAEPARLQEDGDKKEPAAAAAAAAASGAAPQGEHDRLRPATAARRQDRQDRRFKSEPILEARSTMAISGSDDEAHDVGAIVRRVRHM